MTVTNKFLREEVDVAVVYVVGEKKRGALDEVLADHGKLNEVPGRIIREMQDVTLFIDIS